MTFVSWRTNFEQAALHRPSDPDWTRGARLPRAVVRSVQRFQLGESGDGAGLIRKAERTGDADYATAVKLFVAEERDHARLLAELLYAAGAPTIDAHWTDTAFVRMRRPFGLRAELLVLMVAEVVALRYYRAMRDGSTDPLAAEVGRRILADERRHVPFHLARLDGLPVPVRWAWRAVVAAATVVVAVDHGTALRAWGVSRRAFIRDTLAEAHLA
ncbi:hypothetical protein BTM25_08230 [Actinomadura rubteroloni]|uniref:Ferritin-like domain-containing protein n=1 Tax=Actinomadura rubteroloni TaxID=1926885 RepID=A0A2P4UMZ4_9ACTN|nr:ferritin-like domain-containing protein [Actinomadura rubteroloni]POM26423.1 hypothetical protein BTM25_08230 [Actinomadura rubteroloni]